MPLGLIYKLQKNILLNVSVFHVIYYTLQIQGISVITHQFHSSKLLQLKVLRFNLNIEAMLKCHKGKPSTRDHFVILSQI